MLRSTLTSNSIVVPAVDVDNTTFIYAIPDGKNEMDETLYKTPPKSLSPKAIQFIHHLKSEAKEAKATVPGIAFVTHRCFLTELDSSDYSARILNDAKQSSHLNISELRAADHFTCKVAENLSEETGLPILGISTPDDAILGRKFGDAYNAMQSAYHKSIPDEKISAADYKNVVLDNIKLHSQNNLRFALEFDGKTKNPQLKQLAEYLSAKFPHQQIIIPFCDDVGEICASALAMPRTDLPPNVKIVVFTHSARKQTDFTYLGTISGLRAASTTAITRQLAKQDIHQHAQRKHFAKACHTGISGSHPASISHLIKVPTMGNLCFAKPQRVVLPPLPPSKLIAGRIRR